MESQKECYETLNNLDLQEQINILKTKLNEACENIKNLHEENKNIKSELDYIYSKICDLRDEIRWRCYENNATGLKEWRL